MGVGVGVTRARARTNTRVRRYVQCLEVSKGAEVTNRLKFRV